APGRELLFGGEAWELVEIKLHPTHGGEGNLGCPGSHLAGWFFFGAGGDLEFRNGGGDKILHFFQEPVFLAGQAVREISDVSPTLKNSLGEQVASHPPHPLEVVRSQLIIRDKPIEIVAFYWNEIPVIPANLIG